MASNTSIEIIKKISGIMDILLNTEEDLGVRELSRLCDIPKSTVGRILSSLEEEGWVCQSEDTKKYRIGLKMLNYANRWRLDLELVKQSSGYMENLVKATRQTAILTVYDKKLGGRCINKLESDSTIKLVSSIGKPIPLHAGATGKMILAYLPENIKKDISEGPLSKFTPNTIIDPIALEKELDDIRKKGYATSVEEIDPGASAIGAPIFDEKGGLVAGLSIAGPKYDFDGRFDELVPIVVETAREISDKLKNCKRRD
ncbi:MAG TPA: IclR family transcriptional regulator [Clostridia bacterium]|nr:IclR family transcriptional regulator [Clostridia bacterium]